MHLGSPDGDFYYKPCLATWFNSKGWKHIKVFVLFFFCFVLKQMFSFPASKVINEKHSLNDCYNHVITIDLTDRLHNLEPHPTQRLVGED